MNLLKYLWYKLVGKEVGITSLKGLLCEYCYKAMSIDKRFYCNYCKKYHCDQHRLPEEHKCPNPKLPKSMSGYRESYSREGKFIEGK